MRYLIIVIMLIATMSCSKDDGTSNDNTSNDNDEPKKVYIYSVRSSPTDSESITIKNNSGVDKDLSGWTLGDLNEPEAYSIPNNTLLSHEATTLFPRNTLGFQINDNDETLYLKDNSGNIIDTWRN